MRRDDDVPEPMKIRWRTLITGLVLGAVLACTFSWVTRWPGFDIPETEIGSAKTFDIAVDPGVPHALTIKVTGHLDGHAILETHDTSVRIIGNGPVNETISREYYEPVSQIRYNPHKVGRGWLRIEYKCKTI